MSKVNSGITFINVVVVFVILVVLAAILFPVFAKAHEHSGPTMPFTLRNYQSACNMYANDNNDRFPIVSPLEFEVNPLSDYARISTFKRKECFRRPECELRKTIGYEDIKFQYILNSKCASSTGEERFLLGPKSSIETPETAILFSIVLKRLKDRIPIGFVEGRPRIQRIGDLVLSTGPCTTLSTAEAGSIRNLQLRNRDLPIANWNIPMAAVEQFKVWAELESGK